MKSAPGSARESQNLDQPIVSALSFLILFGGIATVAIALYMVVLCYTRLPWSDGWGEIAGAAAGGNLFSVARLWQQHNEHRLLIPGLFMGLDLLLCGASQKLLLTIIFVVQLLHLCLLSWSMRALGGWTGPVWRNATGLAALCLFCPTQWENLTWGFQTCFVLPPLFATASFVALLVYWRSRPPRAWKLIFVSVVAALTAVGSLANGLLVLPLLVFAAYVLIVRRGVVFIYGAASLVSTAFYFYGYVSPPQSSDPLSLLRAPAKLASYVATYFGSSWTAGNSWDNHNLQIAPYFGWCGFAVLVWFLLRSRRMVARRQAFPVLLLLLALFCAGTAFLTAFGRIASGTSQAFSSRYQTIALLFWFSMSCLLLGAASESTRRFGLPAIQVLLVVVLLRGAILVHLPLREAREHAFQQRAAAAALLSSVEDREQIARSYPDPDHPLRLAPFMRDRRLSVFAEKTELDMPVSAVARIADRERCQGQLQSVAPVGDGESKGLRIAGWAWDSQAHEPAMSVLTVSNGIVVGVGAAGDWRPEIRAHRPYMNTSFIGFTAYAKSMPTMPVSVYAVLPGSASLVCEIAVVPR
jgi:hypothetical protein